MSSTLPLARFTSENIGVPVEKSEELGYVKDFQEKHLKDNRIGFLISDEKTPSDKEAIFICDALDLDVRKGEFVGIDFKDSVIISKISRLKFYNPKYANSDFLFFNLRDKKEIRNLSSVKDNTFLLGELSLLGALNRETVESLLFPPPPGSVVRKITNDELNRFIGFYEEGLSIGQLIPNNIDVKLNIEKLIKNHFAILAMTGAGKTNLTKILISELAKNNKNYGVLIFDFHGEYGSLKELFPDITYTIPAEEIKISCQHLNEDFIRKIDPNITDAQLRAYSLAFKSLKKEKVDFNLDDILNKIEKSRSKTIKDITAEPLLSRLERIKKLNMFLEMDFPNIREFLKPSKIYLINMLKITSLLKKQAIVYHILEKLFNFKVSDNTYPHTVIILEEVHNLAPSSASQESSISKGIISKIAREGRKFGISLGIISQRPVNIDTTLLSQCNTNFFLRITNPYDLEQIGKASENITKEFLDQIPDLKVGTCLLVGQAVNYPIYVKTKEITK